MASPSKQVTPQKNGRCIFFNLSKNNHFRTADLCDAPAFTIKGLVKTTTATIVCENRGATDFTSYIYNLLKRSIVRIKEPRSLEEIPSDFPQLEPEFQ